MNRFVALDLETTGLDRENDEPIEAALVRFVDGKPGESVSLLVRPKSPLRPFIAALTGIPREELDAAPEFAEVADRLSAFVGSDPIVAYNAAMDRLFLEKAYAQAGKPAPAVAWIDALVPARMAWPRLANHKLETVVEHLGLEGDGAHRALPDAMRAGEVFVAALAELDARGVRPGVLAKGTPFEAVFPAPAEGETPEWKPISPEFPAVAECEPPAAELEGDAGGLSAFFRRVWAEGRIGIAEVPAPLSGPAAVDALARALPSSGERWVLVVSHHELEKWSKALRERGVEALVLRKSDRYVCRRRLELFSSAPANALTPDERTQLATMLAWWNTASPDEEEWAGGAGFNAQRNFQLWQKICSHPAGCSDDACGEGACPGRAMRRLAEDAQAVVIDKELFFRDVQRGLTLLPRWDHLMVFESEKIPAASALLLEDSVRFYRLRNIVQRFANPWSEGTGLLHAASSLAPESAAFGDLAAALRACEHEFQKTLTRIGLYARKQKVIGDMGYGKSLVGLGATSLEGFHASLDACDGLIDACDAACGELAAGNRWFGLLRPEFAILRQELRELRADVDRIVEARDPQRLHWAKDWANPHHISIHAAPRNPGQAIGGALNRWARSICWIGSPLAVSRYLDRFLLNIGTRPSDRLVDFSVRRPDAPPTLLCDWATRDESTQPDMQEQQRQLAIAATRCPGRIVVLLPHDRQIPDWQRALIRDLPDRLVLAEGSDGPLATLLGLRGSEHAVVFATDWPADLPCGENDLLVIPRIPFAQGRSSYLEQLADSVARRRGNAFQEVYVPEAALLLRRWLDAHPRTPRLVLDPRAVNSRYAKKLAVLWGRDAKTARSDAYSLTWTAGACGGAR